MRSVKMDIVYPKYFSVELKDEFNPVKVTVGNLLAALTFNFNKTYERGAPWDKRKLYSRIIEKIYDVEGDVTTLELSEEQYDYVMAVLKGELPSGTAFVYILEAFEAAEKIDESKK